MGCVVVRWERFGKNDEAIPFLEREKGEEGGLDVES